MYDQIKLQVQKKKKKTLNLCTILQLIYKFEFGDEEESNQMNMRARIKWIKSFTRALPYNVQ